MKHLILSLALGAFSLATAPAYAWGVGATCDGQCGLIVASAKCKHIKSSAENLQCTLQNGGMAQDTPALCAQAKAVSGCTMKADAGKAKPPSGAAGTLTPQQIAACSQEIKAKQIESQRWSGNVNDISARLGRFQKDLFEGRCKGHPEAQAYIAGANKMIGYGGNASGGDSSRINATPPSVAPGKAASSSSKQLKEKKYHYPEYVATQCLSVINEKTLYGGFINSCPFKVAYGWCVEEPKKGGWSESAACGNETRGAGQVVGAKSRDAQHTKGGKKVHWVACMYEDRNGNFLDVGPRDVSWDGQKKQMNFRCGDLMPRK